MRLYFDECVSSRLPLELKAFFAVDYPELETGHVLDTYKQGTGDSKWLAPLTSDPTIIVITQDHGKDPKKEKLPVICQSLGITYVTFSTCVLHAGYTVQKTALVTVWSDLMRLNELPRGTRARLTIGQAKGNVPRYELRIGSKLAGTVLNELSG